MTENDGSSAKGFVGLCLDHYMEFCMSLKMISSEDVMDDSFKKEFIGISCAAIKAILVEAVVTYG